MRNIKEVARNFLLVNKIHTLPIPLEELLQHNSWHMLTYGEAQEFLLTAGLWEYAESRQGFCYYRKEKQEYRIFISDGLGYEETRRVMAHEIGHIVLGHTSLNGVMGKSLSTEVESEQEKEAQAFALELLAPIPLLIKKKIRTRQQVECGTMLNEDNARIVAEQINDMRAERELIRRRTIQKLLVAALFILLLCCGLYIFRDTKQIQVDNRPAVVTKSGDKYHQADCQYVQGKTVTNLTIQEAKEAGKHPCEVCEPEDK